MATKTKRYEPRPGFHITTKQATAIGETIEKMRANGVSLTRENFYTEARRKSSPAHSVFDWDAQKAAIAYWTEQAGYFLRGVQVVINEPNIERHAVRVRIDEPSVYMDRKEILRSDRRLDAASVQAHKEVMGAVRRAEIYGLEGLDPYWKQLCQAARNGRPRAKK